MCPRLVAMSSYAPGIESVIVKKHQGRCIYCDAWVSDVREDIGRWDVQYCGNLIPSTWKINGSGDEENVVLACPACMEAMMEWWDPAFPAIKTTPHGLLVEDKDKPAYLIGAIDHIIKEAKERLKSPSSSYKGRPKITVEYIEALKLRRKLLMEQVRQEKLKQNQRRMDD